MKRILFIFVATMGTLLALDAVEPYLKGAKFMSRAEAVKRFGGDTFTPEKFRDAGVDARGKMVVSLLDSKTYIGKSAEEVRKSLGPSDGHFWNDSIPAYFLNEGWKTKTDTWQIVFLLNRKGLVNELKIHRNCCS